MMAVCAAGSAALAVQTATPPQPIDMRALQRLDQARQDTGPLATSLLLQPTDLRIPLDFEDVYRVGNGDRLARINGGLAAVFPRSTYLVTSKGLQAQVPPGTVYYLGSLPKEPVRSRSVSPVTAAMFADTRAGTLVDSEQGGRQDPTPEIRSQTLIRQEVRDRDVANGIMTDEGYRAVRVRSLLQAAAASSQSSR
jgi:hypothetical protein